MSTEASRQLPPSPLGGLTALWWIVSALLLSWLVYLLVIVFRPHPCCPISFASPTRAVLGGLAVVTAIGSGFFLTRKARRGLIRPKVAVGLSLVLALIVVGGCIAFGSSLESACLCILEVRP